MVDREPDRRQAQEQEAGDESTVQVRPEREQRQDRQWRPPNLALPGGRLAALPPEEEKQPDQQREDQDGEAGCPRMDHG
jgi:hypothetical protein